MVHHAWGARNEVGQAFLPVCREQLLQGNKKIFHISFLSFHFSLPEQAAEIRCFDRWQMKTVK